jgi:DNA-binding CsgD family transcriptional regulator
MAKIALTEQQQEVARLYKARVSARQIALLLNISTQRVYQHVDRLRALGVIARPPGKE